ncbi:Dynamin family-domain-containing protein [Neocallimastix sp. 'constans']
MSNNNEYLYSQIEKCSQTTLTSLLEDNISNKDIENIGSNISSKIKDCIENATKILDDKNEDIKAIKSNLMKLNDKLNNKSPNINIYIIGNTNNGKSSFINSLLNQDIVPEEENSSKVGFCEIINSNEEEIHITDNNDETIILKKDENISQCDQILDYMSNNNNIEFKDVKIYCKFALFGKYSNNVKIIDSPGFDIIEAQNVINNKINNKKDDIDIVIAVIKCQDKITDPMRKYLKKLYSEKKTKHIFFVINHFHTYSKPKRNGKAKERENEKERIKKIEKQRENEKKRIKEIEDSIKDISKESYDKKKFYVHHVCLYCTTTREDICPLENPVDEFNKFKSCLEKYVGLFNIYYKFESQILFFKDYIIKGESILRDIIKMHEKEKTELENKKEENEEQINLLDEYIKKVSDGINNYINENEQQVKEVIEEKFETIFQVFDKESQNSNNQEMMGIFKDILKGFIESNIKDIKEIYSKNISSFKHENKVMEEKIKNKLNNFYTENDNNKNYSLLLDEILNPQLRCSFKDNKLNSSLMSIGKKMILESSLFNPEKINSISEELFIFAVTNNVKYGNKSKDYLDELLINNNYLLYGGAIIGCLCSYYIYGKRVEKKEKDKIEKQIAINKLINDIYGCRKSLLENFEINNNNTLDSEIIELKDFNKSIDLKINEENGIITNIKKNISDLDHEIEELRKYFNNIVILVR